MANLNLQQERLILDLMEMQAMLDQECTEEEKKIISMLADGLSLVQIAQMIGKSVQGTKNVTMRLRDRLGADTSAQLVGMAMRRGIIS